MVTSFFLPFSFHGIGRIAHATYEHDFENASSLEYGVYPDSLCDFVTAL